MCAMKVAEYSSEAAAAFDRSPIAAISDYSV
jgi:hypothetical protein